jgi:hypothetical protein
MNARRDPDRLIHDFVLEGAERLNDRVFDEVRAEIEQRPQRVVIGPWRMPTLNKLVPIGLGAAAVVALLVLGNRLLGPPSSTVGGAASEPPASAATDGSLPEGSFTVQDVAALADAPRITVTIPAPGWRPIADFGGLVKGPDEDPPQSAMLLWSWPAGTTIDVYGAGTTGTPASTVDEAAAALAAQPSRDASDPADVTVGEYVGKHVTVHVPEDWDASSNDCDQGNFASYGVNGGEPARYHQGAGQIDELWILDVDGSIAIIDAMYRPDTPTALIEEMRSIAESATFEAP